MVALHTERLGFRPWRSQDKPLFADINAAQSFDRPEFIGSISINDSQGSLTFASCIDFGWPLGTRYWRQGFATETAEGALEFVLMKVGLGQVVSIPSVSNTA